MVENLFLQIFVMFCFIALIFVLFFDKEDYLTYSILIILIAGITTYIFMPETINLEFIIEMIDWEVIFFLIGIFVIIEILKEKKIFHEISKRIVNKYKNNIRKLFYFLCITSTVIATLLEDLSVAIIFGPIIVITCLELKINPTPFLLGMTVCINLASTLLPFGSAESIIIVNAFNLDILWFIKYFGIFFVISTILTLVLLDKFMLKKYLKKEWNGYSGDGENGDRINLLDKNTNNFKENQEQLFSHEVHLKKESLESINVDTKTFNINMCALVLLMVLLIFIPTLYLPCFIGALIFVFINPVKQHGKLRPSISHFFKKVDYKLIFFLICLFILVGLLEVNGSLLVIEQFILSMTGENLFLLCVAILIITSILSGFLDNAPVTVIFVPIINMLLEIPGFHVYSAPIIISFVLGVNLGGNFLPQGSACDMMTLEIARQNGVHDLSYKKLVKVGGSFALLHILVGIVYLAIIIFILPF
ncbi:MAG: SLC13 family permease [Promethearchaeota archaeon]